MNCTYPTALGELWPNVPVADWRPYMERYPDTFDGEKMRLEIGCYLVRSQGQTILIDTGYGPGPIDYIGGLRGELMADLARKKVDPRDVNTVFLSHLHLDHVGWNTVDSGGKYVPTFPNARYLAHQADLDHFRKPEVQAASRYPYIAQCIEPLVDLGIFDTCSGDTDLTSELRALHTPGHTPGHMSVLVSSQGEKAMIQGDVLIHPAQVTEEGWTPLFDGDSDASVATRRKLLDQMEADGTTVVSCHFPAPGFGKIVRAKGKRYWQAGL
ncbi:MAG: MBL fold metallo-hydrolase [Chloroflexi bacterium]|nr:MBL fold metallo-hydrolase [Chloroflexota bacterium]